MSRLNSQISIVFTDPDSVEQTAAASVSVRLELTNEMLESSGEDSYGSKYFIAGAQSWRAETTQNEVTVDGARTDAQLGLEELFANRSKFAVTYTSPAGTEYDGTAWISSLTVTSGDEQVLRASIQFEGVGELTKTAVET